MTSLSPARLNREILRLSVPSILAGITVPLVGMVDTAIAGHLGGAVATQIGAISVGSMVLSLLYWVFGFLRTGTGGLTAQAFGREDPAEARSISGKYLPISSFSRSTRPKPRSPGESIT